ncbi:CRAL-TRIO domain-containing protein [Aphelenchoides fujianensis]|nr:CRAL-TRIO domain-containing protein [Aphelenchoides fujianensis]
MKYVAAYLLAGLGGKGSPSVGDLENILGSVGAEFEKENAETVVKLLNGKDIDEVLSTGLTKLASRQKFNRNSLMFNAANEQALIQLRLNSGCFKGRDVDELNSKDSLVIYNFLCSLLAYSLRTLTVDDGASRYANIVVLIDSGRVPVKVLRVVLRACQNALAYKIKQAVVIAPDRFLDQQRMGLDILLDAYDFKTTMCARSKLWKFVDSTMLFHGSLDSSAIVGSRSSRTTSGQIPRISGRRINTSCIAHLSGFFKRDQSVMIELSESSKLHEQKVPIHEDRLQMNSDDEGGAFGESSAKRASKPEPTAASRPSAEQKFRMEVLEARALRLQEVIGWLEGPFESAMADFPTRVCETPDEAAGELRELWEKMRRLLDEAERRVEQSALKMRTLKRFHEIKQEFYKEADVLLKSLCSDPKDLDLGILKKHSNELAFKTQVIEDRFEEAESRPNGESDEQAAEVARISEHLSFLNKRRRRCLGLSDMQRLKTEQFIQLLTAEEDARRVVEWLEELRANVRPGDPITKITKFQEVANKMLKYGTEAFRQFTEAVRKQKGAQFQR